MSRHEVVALVVGTVVLISGEVGSSDRKEEVLVLGSRAIEECFSDHSSILTLDRDTVTFHYSFESYAPLRPCYEI